MPLPSQLSVWMWILSQEQFFIESCQRTNVTNIVSIHLLHLNCFSFQRTSINRKTIFLTVVSITMGSYRNSLKLYCLLKSGCADLSDRKLWSTMCLHYRALFVNVVPWTDEIENRFSFTKIFTILFHFADRNLFLIVCSLNENRFWMLRLNWVNVFVVFA